MPPTHRALRAVLATAAWAGTLAVLPACSSPDSIGIDDAMTAGQDDAAYKVPAPGVPWQMVLNGDSPADAGAAVYDLDASASAAQMDALRAVNPSVYLVCYLSVGTWEEWRGDAGTFPAEVLGGALTDSPGERYVDVRALDVLGPIWRARLDACAAAGFDAVDPDNIDVYANDSGFTITREDVSDMMIWLANEAHAGWPSARRTRQT